MDILAYLLISLEKHDGETYENEYLFYLFFAWNLTKQYVNKWSISFIVLFLLGLIFSLIYLFSLWLM